MSNAVERAKAFKAQNEELFELSEQTGDIGTLVVATCPDDCPDDHGVELIAVYPGVEFHLPELDMVTALLGLMVLGSPEISDASVAVIKSVDTENRTVTVVPKMQGIETEVPDIPITNLIQMAQPMDEHTPEYVTTLLKDLITIQGMED